MEQEKVVKSTKKIITILIIVIIILSGITGGLVYADHINFKYTPVQEQFPDNLSITFSKYGTYKAVYDTQKNIWTLGLWEDTLILTGEKTISDLQKEGGVISFTMPWDGEINSTAGEIYIDGKKWKNGNPVINTRGKSTIKKGQGIEIRYGVENQSAGFQIIFQ